MIGSSRKFWQQGNGLCAKSTLPRLIKKQKNLKINFLIKWIEHTYTGIYFAGVILFFGSREM